MRKLSFLLIFITINFTTSLFAQVDIGSWSSFQLNYKAGKKVTLTAKPIVRHNSDLSKYSDTSIDFIVAYKINSSWSASLLNRHFFIPDGGDREFWFMDLNYKLLLGSNIDFSNKLRYHLAVNWNRADTDFIRYHPKLSFRNKSKITPFVGMELFYRIEGDRSLSGSRYVLGFNTMLVKKIKLTIQYWRQTKYNDEHPLPENHVFLINFGYNLN